MNRLARVVMAVSLALAAKTAMAQPFPLGSAITYQGQLKTAGAPYSGTADFVFRLYDSPAGATQIGGAIAHNGIVVNNGTFTVSLDFGMLAYNGEERWLAIDVHTPANGGIPPYTTLTPRQRLAAAPYALRALAAVISGVQPNALSFTNGTNNFVGGSLSIDGNTLNVDSANDRVGIGTATPASVLEVREAGNGTPSIHLTNTNDARTTMSFGAPFRQWLVGQNLPPDGGLLDQFFIYDANAAATRLSIDTAGNVGMGTNNPTSRLHVMGDITAQTAGGVPAVQVVSTGDATTSIRLAAPFQTWQVGQNLPPDGGQLDQFFIYDQTSNATRLSISDSGLVGIGTNSPGTRVHIVDGNASMNTLQAVNTAAAGVGAASGVVGITSQATAFSAGVRGLNANDSGTGVIGSGNNSGSVVLAGGSGGAFTGLVTGVFAKSTTAGFGEGVYADQFGDVTRVSFYNGTLYKVIGTGTVSTIVNGVDEQPITMFAPESPEVLFQDFGQAVLLNGFAHVDLDPNFAKNVRVDAQHPMRVFIQLEDNENCQGVVIKNKTPFGFDVVELRGGKSNTPFQYQISCNRADTILPSGRPSAFADLRFPPAPQAAPTLTGQAGLTAGQLLEQPPKR